MNALLVSVGGKKERFPFKNGSDVFDSFTSFTCETERDGYAIGLAQLSLSLNECLCPTLGIFSPTSCLTRPRPASHTW